MRNPIFGKQVAKPAEAHAANLETILRAAKSEQLILLECQFRATGERVAALATVAKVGDEYTFTPFAILLNGNPYEMLNPPNPDGGFFGDEDQDEQKAKL